MKKFIIISFLITISFSVFSQSERKHIRKGNILFNYQKIDDAGKYYENSLAEEPNSLLASFNLADVLYKQEKYDLAEEQFKNIAHLENDKTILAKTPVLVFWQVIT